MAALQTLRNKPALLMSVIGGALLLFIITLTDFNSCSRPNVEGEINGKELTYEDFETQVSNEENLETLLLGSISEEEKESIRQGLWVKFLQSETVAGQAKRLGLIVTKEDVQNALTNVTPQQLQQVMQMLQYGQINMAQISYAQKIMLLMANYMGQPSVDAYKQFLKSADQQISQLQKQNPEAAELYMNLKNACLYCESQIPQELLMNKYMAILQAGVTANPVTAKMDFDENNTVYNLQMASVPYSTIADKDIKITDEELQKKYEECKEMFRIPYPSRDLKAINVTVTASAKDQENIYKQVKALEDTLRQVSSAEAVEAIMKGSKTEVNYMNAYLPKDLFTQGGLTDVASALDSMSVGTVTTTTVEPKGNDGTQYISTFKLVGTKTTPDSMQICQFAVDSKALADSIVNAVKGGKSVSELAKQHNDLVQKYSLKGDTTWNATRYYVDTKASTDSAASAYTDICQMPVGTVAYYTVPNQQTGQPIYVVTQVLSSKAPSMKYNVAVVKYPITFSQETYNNKRRALFEFLAKNNTIEALEKNANKSGYTLLELTSMNTSDAMTARMSIGGEGAKDAFTWAFDEAEVGNVSQVYECGKNNDQLLVLCVTGIHDGKYLEWNTPSVKRQLEALVMQDKKAEKLFAQLKNVKTPAQAKSVKGAEVSDQPEANISYFASYEPAVAGAVERAQKGKTTGWVKGANGVYLVQVNDKKAGTQTFNAGQAMLQQNYRQMSAIFGQNANIIEALQLKNKIEDNRYKF